MRIALLGVDEDSLRAAEEATACGHHIAVAVAEGKYAAALRRLAPEVTIERQWENVLAGKSVDAVYVARPLPAFDPGETRSAAEIREEQLRRIAQESIPLLLPPPACNLDCAYELESIRRDRSGTILSLNDEWNHPVWDRLRDVLQAGDSGPLGPIEQWTWDRFLPDRSREAVHRRFVQDMAILRRLFGPIRTIFAAGAQGETHYDPFAPKPNLPELNQLTVHVGIDQPCIVRWSVGPASPRESGRLVATGPRGSLRVVQMSGSEPWRIETNDTEATLPSPPSLWPEIELAVRDKINRFPAWLDTCRDLEALEAIDRSLLRGRTVPLHSEEAGEEAAFKGIMASWGCLVLMLVPLTMLAVAVIDGLHLGGPNVRQLWPTGVAVVIGLFLALQGLRLFTRPPAKPESTSV